MERIRPFLMITLIFLGLLLWQAWEDKHNPQIKPDPVTQSNSYDTNVLPSRDSDSDVPKPPISANKNVPANNDPNEPTELERIETDVFNLGFNSKGGLIAELLLKDYPISINRPNDYVEMLNTSNLNFFAYQNGLAGDENLPNHNSQYDLEFLGFENTKDKDNGFLTAVFKHSKNNIIVKKTYRIEANNYLINVEYLIQNNSSSAIAVHNYEQLKRKVISSRNGLIYTYAGAVFSTPDNRYEKYDFDDLSDQPIKEKNYNSWIGNMQHYFVAALIPPPSLNYSYYSKTFPGTNEYTVGLVSDGYNIEPNKSIKLQSSFYVGPKTQPVLQEIAPGLDLTVDYGILWFLSKPLFITLSFIYEIVRNWGWAIIILTILIKLIFYPLSAAGYRSMAKLKTVQPKMMAIKERYSTDKTQMNQAMMKLYKDEKINPLGGCFPILVQIPVFIALYWVLLESVEMRQAPFVGWINDLSSKDPFFVLPVLMGLSMWVQQKLNPPPVDPIQAKVMQFLPIMFTAFFAFFPSGLVLYWLANNVLSILQQWRITQQLEKK